MEQAEEPTADREPKGTAKKVSVACSIDQRPVLFYAVEIAMDSHIKNRELDTLVFENVVDLDLLFCEDFPVAVIPAATRWLDNRVLFPSALERIPSEGCNPRFALIPDLDYQVRYWSFTGKAG